MRLDRVEVVLSEAPCACPPVAWRAEVVDRPEGLVVRVKCTICANVETAFARRDAVRVRVERPAAVLRLVEAEEGAAEPRAPSPPEDASGPQWNPRTLRFE